MRTRVQLLLVTLLWLLSDPALADRDLEAGARLYEGRCAGCHNAQGQGQAPWYPSLQEIVPVYSAAELVLMIDTGQFRRAGSDFSDTTPGHTIPIMPSWADLTDLDMARLVNFLKHTLTEERAWLSAAEVGVLRNPNPHKALSNQERRVAQSLYLEHCAACHGADRLGTTGPPLTRWPLIDQSGELIEQRLHYGSVFGMPGWGVETTLSGHQITLLSRYLKEAPLDIPGYGLKEMKASWVSHKRAADAALPESFPGLFVSLLHDTGEIVFINKETKRLLRKTHVGFAPYHLRANGHYLFVLTLGGWVTQIDLRTLRVSAQIRAGYETASFDLSTDKDGKARLIVSTISPPGLTLLVPDTLAPIQRIEADQPMSTLVPLGSGQGVIDREGGCIRRLNGADLSTACIAGVPYLRYAAEVPSSNKMLLVGERNVVAVFDHSKQEITNEIVLPQYFTPGNGAFAVHDPLGQVFVLGSMTTNDIVIIGADPRSNPGKAWKILKHLSADHPGTLFAASHERSSYVALDSALSGAAEGAGQITLLNLGQDFSKVSVDIAGLAGIKGTPRAVQPTYNEDGSELWVTLWNLQDEASAIVVLDSRTTELLEVIRDNRLTTATRGFFVSP